MDIQDRVDGVPPAGGYDPFDYRVQEDPHPVYAWMREHAPVYRNEQRDFWALSRYDDVLSALRNPALFSNRNGIALERELWGPEAVKTSFFLAMDPPQHGWYRNLVSSAFTPRRIAAMEPRIRELVRGRLEPLRDEVTFDFTADFAAALPNDVLCEMLGIPAADWDQIRVDTDDLNHRENGSSGRSRLSTLAALRLAAYFVGLVKELRRRPGDDLTSDMIRAEVHGAKLTDSQIVAFLFVMIGAGNESTGKTLGNAWYQGWVHPQVQREGLDGRAEEWASETLRYDSSSQMMARLLTEDTVLHGVRLPAGARVAILPASANRDARVFPEPDRYDLNRDTRRIISFGHGPHHCLGAALARLEMRIALEEIGALVSSYEIDVANARRSHSPHQRGFASLPCEVRRRKRGGRRHDPDSVTSAPRTTPGIPARPGEGQRA
ncbi:Cytochrome P450 [Micromonospora sediminicola]|uniref:Cytochrome P450 n=1 Tax=Micromonospora sediminicola TaxID=946078 RepID=A0A1A9B9V8_9ACTN|nr:cytochrome P450 [Micromonospora sediminicola]SBT65682.1 Cytochrome P450 [Micromonospora sediminicola]